nr:integrase, catalytic region, zinc finger, CCHC-type, peptidase aspartic, catalytic [Tanacetum cinerariifolium]
MQTQTSNNLYNAIMEAGGKDRSPMLALDKDVPVTEGSSETITERYLENYKNVSQDIRDQLNAEAKAVQIILTWIDNDIYSTIDTCPNACKMWKAIERLKQGESINVQDPETNLYWEFGKLTSRDEWQRFVTLVKQSQELKIVSYHKLYDILKQHQNKFNEIRAERLARIANPLALVAQQQAVYHPQNHPSHYTQNSSTRSQQAAARNRGKAIVNSPSPIYDQEPSMVAEDDEMSKDKEIDKLMALISLSFKKICKPTNNNLRTSSNTSRANQDNSSRISRGTRYDNQWIVNVVGARETVGITVVQKSRIQCYNCKEYGHVAKECQKPKRENDTAYHKEKMLLCKQEEAGFQLNAEQADWKDDTDDEPEDQELEAHYMYMAQIQEVNPDVANNSGPIFDSEPLQKDDDDDLANERDLLASLIEKLKCEIDDNKNHNKVLETSNKVLVDKLQDLKKFQAELDRHNDVKYASKVEIDCAKAKGDLISYKMEFEKSSNKYTQKINDLNQMILEMKKELFAHQETISILSQQKEAQIKFHKTREDKELDKVIALENKVKCESSKELFKIKKSVGTIIDGVECYKQTIAKRTYFGHIDPFIQNTIEGNFYPEIRRINADLEKFHLCLKEEMVPDLRYFNSHELEVDSLKSQPETQKTQFLNKIDRLSREYYYVDHMNEILGVYTELDEVTNLQCDYLESLEKCKCLEKELSKRVIPPTSVSRPQLKSNQKEDRVMLNNSQGKKHKVEDHHRNVKFSKNKTSVIACNDSLKAKTSNVNFVYVTCGNCVLNDKHDMCVLHSLNSLNSRTKMPMAVPITTREPKRTVNKSVAKPLRRTVALESTNQNPRHTTRKLYEHVTKTCSWWYPKFTPPGYKLKPKSQIRNVNPKVKIILFIINSGCSKHMTGNLKLLTNFVEKFLGSMKFGNDQIAPILGYGDLVQGTVTIKRVYYVEGLNHNLFSVSQFCDADLEVAFRKSTCYIRDLKGNDLLTGSHGTDLYSITLQDTSSPNPICLMAKATSSQAWLWHRRLSHLNFDTINLLLKNDIMIGLPKLKFVKDHLCSSCELGKSKRNSFQTKTTPSSK